jgi:hypothetical protein
MPVRNGTAGLASNWFEFLQKQKCRFPPKKGRKEESQTRPIKVLFQGHGPPVGSEYPCLQSIQNVAIRLRLPT